MRACANLHQEAWWVLARLADICLTVNHGLARLADIRQTIFWGLTRLADICQTIYQVLARFADIFFWEKCDSPRQICASNLQVSQVWRE
jgi:hypothetical protein